MSFAFFASNAATHSSSTFVAATMSRLAWVRLELNASSTPPTSLSISDMASFSLLGQQSLEQGNELVADERGVHLVDRKMADLRFHAATRGDVGDRDLDHLGLH